MLSLHPAVFLVPFAYHIVTYNRFVNMRIDKTRDWIVIFMFHFRKRVTVFGFFFVAYRLVYLHATRLTVQPRV